MVLTYNENYHRYIISIKSCLLQCPVWQDKHRNIMIISSLLSSFLLAGADYKRKDNGSSGNLVLLLRKTLNEWIK